MTPLLGHESFPGEWISAERAGASWVGEAWFDGLVAPAAWERDAIAALLPAGWTTACDPSGAGDSHPVVFVLGRQRRTAVLFGGTTLPTDADYDEAIMAVPFVRHASGGPLHTYVPWMYATDDRAIWAGNAHYGFGKRMATFDRFDRVLVVSDEAHGAVLQAVVSDAGEWARAVGSDVAPSVRAVLNAFRLPVLGVRGDGTPIMSYFQWSFDAAAIRPVESAVVLYARPGSGLEDRECRPADGGAFEVREMRWRLSWPVRWRP